MPRRRGRTTSKSSCRNDATPSSHGSTNVSHRYGATVALDDVTIEIPARKMVGVIGPDGVGKSTLLALISGVRTIQSGRGCRVRRQSCRTRPTSKASAPASPTCRKGSAAISIRRSAFSRISTSSAGCSGNRRPSGVPASPNFLTATALDPFEDSPGRQAFRRHEAEAQSLLRADQRSGSAHPRRAHHRRRSAVARPVLGPHQHDPRAAPADERRWWRRPIWTKRSASTG